MTTFVGVPTSFPNSNTNLAVMQTSFYAMQAALQGCGLVQTADTGQIDIATLASGASGTKGYEIYRFNDSAQATDPIFIKIFYVNGNVSGPRATFNAVIGQGSDGAGNLTGQTYTLPQPGTNINQGSATGQAYSCHTEGFLWVTFCHNAETPYNPLQFAITRTRAPNYALDGKGIIVGPYQLTSGGSGQRIIQAQRRIDNPTTYSTTIQFCMVPGVPGDTSLLNGDKQLYPCFYNIPDIEQMWSMFAVRAGDFPIAPTTFTAAPYANVQRTFMHLGTHAPAPEVTGDTNFRLAFLWE